MKFVKTQNQQNWLEGCLWFGVLVAGFIFWICW